MSRKRKKKLNEPEVKQLQCFCVRRDFLFLGGLQTGNIQVVHRPTNQTIGTILPDETINAPSVAHLEGVLQLIRDFNAGHAVAVEI